MKLAVYDKVNPERLLGYFDVLHKILGRSYSVPIIDTVDVRSVYEDTFFNPVQKVTFEIDYRNIHHSRQVDWATTERTTVSRMCFKTSEDLETLMKLSRFYLPGETSRQQRARRYNARRL